ncbi:dihydrofolate reductase [Puerhibacterium sp. TATVAM-FAB25]|uniref:dihydrofolate reductase n=1 Tax=Puerhibacterium sp. TATVAM-FAB25 TaxID=3093699 RepID=UPI00397B7F9E
MIGLIWAQAHDPAGRAVIGAGGAIPWRVPEDFAHFKRTTSGHPVVMGRLTWESLPAKNRPLPGRTNVVVTRGSRPVVEPVRPTAPEDPAATVRTLAPATPRLVVVTSLEEALAAAEDAPGGEEVWVIGGGQVYAQALPRADRCVVTEVDVEVEGDAFAPPLDPGQWELVDDGAWETSSTGLRYRFRAYARR